MSTADDVEFQRNFRSSITGFAHVTVIAELQNHLFMVLLVSPVRICLRAHWVRSRSLVHAVASNGV